ncbi:MAG: hypothetical protein WA208_05415 [Thermoanaerobaculia bacterium]
MRYPSRVHLMRRTPDFPPRHPRTRPRAFHLVLVLLALLLPSCSKPARVEIVNASGTVLSDVLLVSNGATVRIGNLSPKGRRSVTICPSRESSLDVQFLARRQERYARTNTYLECSNLYRLRVEIAPDLSAKATYLAQPPSQR